MIISDKYKYIFIGIPKTATASIRTVLCAMESRYDTLFYLPPGHKDTINHATALQIMSLNKEIWSKFFKFAFVRNPWDRVVSWYMYRRNKNTTPTKGEFEKWLLQDYDKCVEHEANALLLYKEAKKKVVPLNAIKNYKINYMLPCLDWITDDQGKIMVDYVGKFERLAKDWKVVCGRIGINAQLPMTNVTNTTHYSMFYTKETERIIADRFKKDIEAFGYKFERKSKIYNFRWSNLLKHRYLAKDWKGLIKKVCVEMMSRSGEIR